MSWIVTKTTGAHQRSLTLPRLQLSLLKDRSAALAGAFLSCPCCYLIRADGGDDYRLKHTADDEAGQRSKPRTAPSSRVQGRHSWSQSPRRAVRMQAEKFIQKSNRWNHDGSISLFSAQPIPSFVEHFFQNGNDGSFNVHQHLDFIIF